jgi:hypothetical protein
MPAQFVRVTANACSLTGYHRILSTLLKETITIFEIAFILVEIRIPLAPPKKDH